MFSNVRRPIITPLEDGNEGGYMIPLLNISVGEDSLSFEAGVLFRN